MGNSLATGYNLAPTQIQKNLKIHSSMEELRIPVDPGIVLLLGKITEQKVLNIQQFVQLNRMFKYIL